MEYQYRRPNATNKYKIHKTNSLCLYKERPTLQSPCLVEIETRYNHVIELKLRHL